MFVCSTGMFRTGQIEYDQRHNASFIDLRLGARSASSASGGTRRHLRSRRRGSGGWSPGPTGSSKEGFDHA